MGKDNPLMAKKKSKRTQQRFWNGVVSCIRTNFARYSPKYEDVKNSRKIKEDRYKQDGELHKVKSAWIVCDLCNLKVKENEINIDHIDPVIALDKKSSDYTLDEIFRRIDCDESNLQVICKECHDKKTAEEKEIRKQNRNKNKVIKPKKGKKK